MNFANPGAQHLGGDPTLCFDLRSGYLGVTDLLRSSRETLTQLRPLDEVSSHDQEVDQAMLDHVGQFGGDKLQSRLICCRSACQTSVHNLEQAHRLVAGLFKGEMRDASEEALARTLKGARSSLEKLTAVVEAYSIPTKPHEIRRNALSYLIVQSKDVQDHFAAQLARCDKKTSPDLKDGLVECAHQIGLLTARLEKLRERCSQKMEGNLQECVVILEGLHQRMANIELEAGLRANLWFPDYARRTKR